MMFIRNIILSMPPWLLYFGTVAIVIISIYIGFFLARGHVKAKRMESEGPINTIVAATMGLLAFILAFTFGVTTSRFEDRKSLVGDLDRSGSGKPGLIRVPTQPMIDLQHRMTPKTE